MSFEFLIEMGWKSALVAVLALGVGLALKSRSAEDRAAMLRLAVGLILLLPLISLLAPGLEIQNPLPTQPSAQVAYDMTVASANLPATPAVQAAPAAANDMPPLLADPEWLVLGLYLVGLLALGLRLFSGYVTLQRWTWAAEEVVSPVWRKALESARIVAGDRRGTRLLLSDSVPAPLSWGWAQPVILIDQETFARPEDADAVLAHELAHVVRGDWVALMLSRLAVAFFWFNPLVWWLDREMIQQSEEAADAKAVADVEPAHYAQTLMSCIMHSRSGMVPANSIRPSRNGLSRRIYAVLDGRERAIRSGSRWTLAAMIGCAAFAAPLAALELTAPEPPEAPDAASASRTVTIVTHDGHAIPPLPPIPPVFDKDSEAAIKRADAEARKADAKVRIVMKDLDKNLAHSIQAEVQAATAAALAEGARARADAANHRQIAMAQAAAHGEAASARAIAATAQAAARKGLAEGAKGMEQGARDLDNGARNLRREADRLRSASYREDHIAKARRDGHTVTHQELIDAIPKMREGAERMEDSADTMRRQARDMREGR
ncbi:M56 family metallopeptidase [Allosphingosinicella vermicomposti]|uniref:M56 family metallopeptidase n=1 Tax=Allosphingosinicella vermicomposti TaxID=614671 RepID=UPI000D0F0C39|nr:M56 family metallopeptidase [Allosphingosinicella vermicomposti]